MSKELIEKYENIFDNNSVCERIYDKSEIYDTFIKDKIEEIKYICDMNNIPFFATFAIANTNKKTSYISEALPTGSRDMDLTEDYISQHILINSGFDIHI